MRLIPALQTAASIARSPGPSMLAVEAVVVRDCGLACVAFFSNMRVPAALIAAAAVKDAFVMQSPAEDIKKSASWTVLRYVDAFSVLFSSLSCHLLFLARAAQRTHHRHAAAGTPTCSCRWSPLLPNSPSSSSPPLPSRSSSWRPWGSA